MILTQDFSGGKYIKIGDRQVPRYFFQDIPADKRGPPASHKKHKIIASVVTGSLPLSFEVAFQSASGDKERTKMLTGATFDEEFEKHEINFTRQFQTNFNFGAKWSKDHENFAMAALSNMIGGMVSFLK